jgi:isoprenylcysteine carboxyl methyltransferase (ICMT) family protein YpbQ
MDSAELAIDKKDRFNRQSMMELLTRPWVDRALALAAIAPFVWTILANYKSYHFVDIPFLAYLANLLIFIGTMLFRRAPVRVTPNPWFWLLTFVATYWGFLAYALAQHGRALAPGVFLDTVAVLGTAVVVWGRFSLGRNIGFVPAQREIVIRGAYRFMRHPIYTGIFIGTLAEALASYSPRNLLLFGLLIFWFVIKSFVEESFLRKDPDYAAYMERVRWRWLPGLI